MNTKTKIALGILGAAAAGVVIGMLVAPEKGSETRKKIKKQTGDWADQLGNLFHKGADQFDELKQKAKSMKASAENKFSNTTQNLG